MGFGVMIALAAGGGLTCAMLARQAGHATDELLSGPLALRTAADNAQIAMLQSRRSEKDFLARRDVKYLEKVDSAVADVKADLDVVIEVAEGREQARLASEAEDYLVTYHEYFKEMAELTIERGLSETEGLEGELRAAVHKVEEDLKGSGHDELTVLMLMCRRHEKDYLMRGAEKYIGRIDTRLSEFDAAVKELGIDEQQAAQWNANWKVYRDAMQRLYEIDQRKAEIMAEFRAATHNVEDKLDEIMAIVDKDAPIAEQAVMEKLALSQLIATVVIGATLLTGVIFAFFLIRSISRPIQAVAKRANLIADGDLRSEALEAKTDDELGQLSKAINAMQDSLNDLVTAIK